MVYANVVFTTFDLQDLLIALIFFRFLLYTCQEQICANPIFRPVINIHRTSHGWTTRRFEILRICRQAYTSSPECKYYGFQITFGFISVGLIFLLGSKSTLKTKATIDQIKQLQKR